MKEYLCLATLALLLAGCSGISTRTHPYLGVPGYAATDPATVQILAAEPNRAKERLGEIYLDVPGEPSRATLEKKLREAAARMGADAVFIVYDRMRVFPMVHADWWGATVTPDARRGVVGIAIKYK